MLKNRAGFNTLDVFLMVYAAFSIFMAASISMGVINDARSDLERTREDAASSVKVAVEILTIEIRTYRKMATLLVQDKRDFLLKVLRAPDPDIHIFELVGIMDEWFPGSLAFTIGNSSGVPVVSDFKGSIGSVCLDDMRNSARQHVQLTPLHGVSSIPHYDITAPIDTRGVLLITFTTQALQSFLDRSRDSRYDLSYAKAGTEMDALRSKIDRQFVFDEIVAGSDIAIYAQLTPNYLAALQQQKWLRLAGYGGGFLLFSVLVGFVLWRLRVRIMRSTSNIQALNLDLQRLSQQDPLTGLSNRRGLDEYFQRLLAQSSRENKAFCLALFDIDHFKRINDELGHQQGDTCLQLVGRLLAEHAKRPMDCAVRFGGEEFLLCWYDVDLEQATQLAEDIRHKTHNLGFRRADGTPLTLSAGLCLSLPGESHSWNEMVRRADEALFRAKRAGRDRVEIG